MSWKALRCYIPGTESRGSVERSRPLGNGAGGMRATAPRCGSINGEEMRHQCSVLFAGAALLAVVLDARATATFCTRTDRTLEYTSPVAVVSADFYPGNGPDLAVAFKTGKRVALYRNDGNGNFSGPVDVLAPPAAPDSSIASLVDTPTSLVTEDFNGDGLPDLAGGNTGLQRFFANLNPGAPGAWSLPADPDAQRGSGLSITATHWNADASWDLVVAESGQVGIALGQVDGSGNPTGVWADMARYASPSAGSLIDVHVADFVSIAGEVRPDVLTVDNTLQQLEVWPGDAVFDGSVDPSQIIIIPVRGPSGPLSPVQAIVRDWDLDSRPDALVLTAEGYVLYYHGNGTRAIFDAPVVTDVAGPFAAAGTRLATSFTCMAHADVTGDGVADLVIADAGKPDVDEGFNWLTVVRGVTEAGAPTFTSGGVIDQWHYAAGDLERQKPDAMVIDDFDGDLDKDVVLLNSDARSLTLYRNKGDGTFDAAVSYPAGGPQSRGGAGSDLDGDGSEDLAVPFVSAAPGQDPTKTLAILDADRAGGLLPARLLAPDAQPGGHAVRLGSVNDQQDALTDAIVTTTAGQVFYAGNGDGTFAPPVAIPGSQGEVRLADVAGSASLDLVIVEGSPSNRIRVMVGDGRGGFIPGATFANVFGYRDHVTGDFFGGSKDDVIVAGTTEFGEGGLYILAYDDASGALGAPRFVSATDFGQPGADFSKLAAGKFDGSRLGVAAASASGDVYVFDNDGTSLSIDPLISPLSMGASSRSLVAADLTGDGLADLALASSNQIVVRESLGSGTFGPIISLASNISNDTLVALDLDGDGLPELAAVGWHTSDVTVFCNLSVGALTLRLGRPGGHDDLHWRDQGVGSVYDVARGDLRDLWLTRGFAGATCLANDLSVASLVDPTPPPATTVAPPTWAPYVSAFYYLVRCSGASCTEPTFGSRSDGVPRFDAGSMPMVPSPCP